MTIQKYDWELIRAHYVQGRENGNGLEFPTMEQLAKEHDIPVATIRSRASREGWGQQRSVLHTKLIQRADEKTLEALADKIAQTNLQAFNVARASLAILARKLIEGAQAGSLSLPDQERLLRMCDMAHRMARRAVGIGDTPGE